MQAASRSWLASRPSFACVHALTAERAGALIRAATALPADRVIELGRGTDSAAFGVDDTWVFRFPIVAPARETLRTEVALLGALAPALPLPIPAFEHVAVDEHGKPRFVGYRLIHGRPLTAERLAALDAGAQEAVLGALAGFLGAVHAYPLDVARAAGVREELVKGGYHAAQRGLLGRLSHLLTTGERRELDDWFARFEAEHPPRAALVHADLKPAHVLLDPDAGRIAAVLDWGDACVGDPDFDLAVISIFFGADVQARVAAHLPGRDPAVVAAKTPFYTMLRWLQDLAYVDARGDDPAPPLTLLRAQLDRRDL
jgi:aminoglycoside 2''-phosphotransferase